MFCAQIGAAVGELEPKYRGRARFRVIPIASKEHRREVAGFDIGSHGLVVLDATGTLRGKIPGHDFTPDDILSTTHRSLGWAPP